MCVCVYVCMCVCVYVCMCDCVFVCVCVFLQMCLLPMLLLMLIRMLLRMHSRMCIRVFLLINLLLCMFLFLHMFSVCVRPLLFMFPLRLCITCFFLCIMLHLLLHTEGDVIWRPRCTVVGDLELVVGPQVLCTQQQQNCRSVPRLKS